MVIEVSGATGATFISAGEDLSPGVHELSVVVVDNTTMVRDEGKRETLMTDSREWLIEEFE